MDEWEGEWKWTKTSIFSHQWHSEIHLRRERSPRNTVTWTSAEEGGKDLAAPHLSGSGASGPARLWWAWSAPRWSSWSSRPLCSAWRSIPAGRGRSSPCPSHSDATWTARASGCPSTGPSWEWTPRRALEGGRASRALDTAGHTGAKGASRLLAGSINPLRALSPGKPRRPADCGPASAAEGTRTLDTESSHGPWNVKQGGATVSGVRNASGSKTVQLQCWKAMRGSQQLNPRLLPAPEPGTHHALTLTSAALIPVRPWGGGRKSVPGSKWVPEICCDEHTGESPHGRKMAAERTDWGALGRQAQFSLPLTDPPSARTRGEGWDPRDTSRQNRRGENDEGEEAKPTPTRRWAGSSPPGSTRPGGSAWFCHWGAGTLWASRQSRCPALKTPWARPPRKSCSVWSASERAGGRAPGSPGGRGDCCGERPWSPSAVTADPAPLRTRSG